MHAMIYEWRSLSPGARENVRRLTVQYEALWHQAIDEAAACGLIKGDAAILRKQVLGGMNSSVAWYRPGGRLDAEAFTDAMLHAALPGLASYCP